MVDTLAEGGRMEEGSCWPWDRRKSVNRRHSSYDMTSQKPIIITTLQNYLINRFNFSNLY